MNLADRAALPIDLAGTSDRPAIVALTLAAYAQYRPHVADWPRFAAGLEASAGLGTTLICRREGRLLGAVSYVPPGAPRPDFFAPEHALIRLLAVDPAARGRGIGRALTAACLDRARADGAEAVALHTTPVMADALGLYLRMGFVRSREIVHSSGLPYAVYLLKLGSQA